MAGASSKTNAPKPRKRVEAETSNSNSTTLLRARDGSAFARCEGCNKNVAVALISMHNCSLDAKIRANLEAQVVETQAEAKKKPAEKKRSTSDEPKPKRLRKATDGKKSSDTVVKPKRPLTPFFIFMNDFRKTFKEENPGSNVKDIAKKGGEKWKSLTEEEKQVYLDKAAELKAEHNKSQESSDANVEEEDEEKLSDDVDDAEEEQVEDAEEKQSEDAEEEQVEDAEEKQSEDAEENEVKNTDHENKEAEGKEEEQEEILDDY